MVPVLLIVIPMLTGLVAFFLKNERTVKGWALLSSLVTLAVSLAGIAVLKDAGYMAAQYEWMGSINSSFSVKLDGLGKVLCLLNAVAFPVIFIATWNSQYAKAI